MKKVLTVLTALVLVLSMTACAGKDDSSTLKVANVTTASPADTSETDNNLTESEQFGKDGDITGYGASLNVYIENENGNLLSAASSSKTQPFNMNKQIDLVVEIAPYPDKDAVGVDLIEKGIFKENGINADIYVFCNGQVIKHSLDPNEEATEKTTITATANRECYAHIYIPPTEIGNVENALLWVCVDQIPEYIPESPRGEIPLTQMWPVAVTSVGEAIIPAAYEAQEQDYIYGEHPTSSGDPDGENEGDEKIYRVDIGKYNERCHSSAKKTMDEVAVIDKDTDFAVTAYFEEDFDYYLAVFCDGELLNAFDGKPLMKANCQGGKRMIKFSLDKKSLPENGAHAYSVIAMPDVSLASLEENWSAMQSNRRMIKTSE